MNLYFYDQNLELQLLYQYLAKMGHESASYANDDDNSMTEHSVVLQLQFVL